MNLTPIQLGKTIVGDGHPTVFVAEVGSFFNKDIDLAFQYLRAAASAGAPIFKTEIIHDADICLAGTGLVTEYHHAAGKRIEDYRALVERKVVPLADYRRLFDLCHELKVPFLATVFDFVGVDFLAETGAVAIKISRDNVNNLPLIRHAAHTGLPMIFDAGVIYFDEIARAVRCAQDAGCGGVVVNHHPGANPARPEVHHMRVMQTYKEALGVPVGLACHYRGDEILYLAVGMGANLLEKGIVDDPDRIESDLVSALPLSEIRTVVEKVEKCWRAIGTAPARHNEPRDLSARKGLIAKRALAADEVLSLENIGFAWPCAGISVEHWDIIAGQRAGVALEKNQPLEWSDVKFASTRENR